MVQVTGNWKVMVPTNLSWSSQIPEGSSLRDSGMPFHPTDRSTVHSLKLYSLVGTIFISGQTERNISSQVQIATSVGQVACWNPGIWIDIGLGIKELT